MAISASQLAPAMQQARPQKQQRITTTMLNTVFSGVKLEERSACGTAAAFNAARDAINSRQQTPSLQDTVAICQQFLAPHVSSESLAWLATAAQRLACD
jgi:hypothetical protein